MIQDLSITLNSRIPLLILKTFFSILTHGFSKTHQPQFLNNNYVCIPKYKNYSVLLPLKVHKYFVLCSRTMTLFSPLIKKCASTYIFIQKWTYTYIFIFMLYFFNIKPTDLQKLTLYIYKVL